MTQRLEMRLYEKYTLEELTQQLATMPQQKQPDSIYLYDKKQRIRREAIGWAIYFKMEETKLRRGA